MFEICFRDRTNDENIIIYIRKRVHTHTAAAILIFSCHIIVQIDLYASEWTRIIYTIPPARQRAT